MAKLRPPHTRLPDGSHIGPRRPPPPRFVKGEPNAVGRARGTPNRFNRYSQAVILEALETFGRDGQGKDGIIGFIHRALHEDVKHGISLLLGITPKLLEANITRTEVRVETIAQLDANLVAAGLPPSDRLFNGDLFKIDFRGSDHSDEADTEAEVAESEPPSDCP